MTSLLIFAVIILILISAFSSASETAITALSPAQLFKLKKLGDKKAYLISKLLKNKEKVISSLLILNNIVNILATSLVTTLLLNMLGTKGAAYATIIMSVSIIIFAEVLPKSFAVIYAKSFTMRIANFLNFIVIFLKPITYILELCIKIISKIFGFKKPKFNSGRDEVRGLIEQNLEEGSIVKFDKDMLGGVLDLNKLSVAEIMTHRNKIESININLPLTDIIYQLKNIPFTRIPVWENQTDNIIGILHVRHFYEELHKNEFKTDNFDIRSILQKAWYIPEHTTLSKQLTEFRQKKQHLAFIISEYGDLMGLLTLEDIIEEIVGQIEDEYDINGELLQRRANGKIIVDGTITIRDLNRELDLNLPDEQATTLAGLIIHNLKIIPEQGEKFQFYNFKAKILKRDANLLKKIQLKPIIDND